MRTNLSPFNAARIFYHSCIQKSRGIYNFFLRFFGYFAILTGILPDERVVAVKTGKWILLIGLVQVLCLGLSMYFLIPRDASTHAQILSDGQILRTVDLRIDQEITVPSPDGGHNVVTVRQGSIAVTGATCPDHYCMKRGFCNNGTDIVCLPNRLVIRFLGEQDIDAVIG